MTEARQRRFENAVAAVEQRHGVHAMRRGSEFDARTVLPHISTGFPGLDAITGCGGVPLGMITLISGRFTSGKLTLAYRLLASAQRSGVGTGACYNVGLLDLNRTADPDFVLRCGVDLNYLLVGRPPVGQQAVDMIGDLIMSRGLRALVVDNLAVLVANRATLHYLNGALGRLQQSARMHSCALILLDEPRAPWMRWLNLDAGSPVRWAAALHIEMQREQWLRQDAELIGYRAQARLLKSRWAYGIRSALLEIFFHRLARVQHAGEVSGRAQGP